VSLVELVEAQTKVDLAVRLLREASVGYLAVRARDDATLFDAVSRAQRSAMAAEEELSAAVADAMVATR
jgi:hypothetical protein